MKEARQPDYTWIPEQFEIRSVVVRGPGSIGGEENVLILIVVLDLDCMTIYICQNLLTVYLKLMTIIVCKLYLN